MRLGHVLAQSGDLELLVMVPVSELMADKRGWNAAHYAAKVWVRTDLSKERKRGQIQI